MLKIVENRNLDFKGEKWVTLTQNIDDNTTFYEGLLGYNSILRYDTDFLIPALEIFMRDNYSKKIINGDILRNPTLKEYMEISMALMRAKVKMNIKKKMINENN